MGVVTITHIRNSNPRFSNLFYRNEQCLHRWILLFNPLHLSLFSQSTVLFYVISFWKKIISSLTDYGLYIPNFSKRPVKLSRVISLKLTVG